MAQSRSIFVLPFNREEVWPSHFRVERDHLQLSGQDKHMAFAGYLKSECGIGHGHAKAIVRWTLAGNGA